MNSVTEVPAAKKRFAFGKWLQSPPIGPLAVCAVLFLAHSCLPPPVKVKVKDKPARITPGEQVSKESALPQIDLKDSRYRKRGSIPLNKYRYEGSLWEGESSWGNLMRDHRARYRGDVLTVIQIQKVFQGASNYKNDPQAQEILVNLSEFSVRVVRTLDNGTLAIYGEKYDYRENNNVRYQTILKGIIRSEDIDDKNMISSERIARFELVTNKKIKFDADQIRLKLIR